MAIRIVRIGAPRARNEGVRFGTVRHLPRGVTKDRYAADDWFDVWLPTLAPSAELVAAARRGAAVAAGSGVTAAGRATADRAWRRVAARYRREMMRPDARHLIEAFAALSHGTNFSVGCYCENPERCHRSVLREILAEHGATLA
ncbi:MAG: DUF488 domain-containing protein [Vicinamibacterales bacterium]